MMAYKIGHNNFMINLEMIKELIVIIYIKHISI